MEKNILKGCLYGAAGSLWWGTIGVTYFKSSYFAGSIELVVHRTIWTSFTLIITTFLFSTCDSFFSIIIIYLLLYMNKLKNLENYYDKNISLGPNEAPGNINYAYNNSEIVVKFLDILLIEKKIKNYLDLRSNHIFEYSVEPKIDGISASLTYENGILETGLSRGDGYEGE